jgi:hypothetical protein
MKITLEALDVIWIIFYVLAGIFGHRIPPYGGLFETNFGRIKSIMSKFSWSRGNKVMFGPKKKNLFATYSTSAHHDRCLCINLHMLYL